MTKDHPRLPDFLASFEAAVVRALLENVRRPPSATEPRSLVLCGGVARNTRLRRRFEESPATPASCAYFPRPKLCTDNAAMVGALGPAGPRPPARPSRSDLDIDAYAR